MSDALIGVCENCGQWFGLDGQKIVACPEGCTNDVILYFRGGESARAKRIRQRAATEKLARIAGLLMVTPQIEEHGYDWRQIDRLLFDPDVQEFIGELAPAGAQDSVPSSTKDRS